MRRRLESAGTTIEEIDGRRRYLRGARSASDGWVSTESRGVQWKWDGHHECTRLAGCEARWGLLAHPERGFMAKPWPCGSRLCPVDWAAKAGMAAHRWSPVLQAALLDHAEVWHVVLTQRPVVSMGQSAVLESELRRWSGTVVSDLTAPPSAPLAAVAGESCLDSYRRWYGVWRRLRTDRACRDLWDGTGALRGTEWTLRKGRGPRVQDPRWHCHGHVLVVAAPGSTFDARRLLTSWATIAGLRRPDGRRYALRSVRPPAGRRGPAYRMGGLWAERVHGPDAVLECLKYPWKPSAMTTYGTLDAWAALRGTRTHQVAGGLHAQSRIHHEGPWPEWLAERPDTGDWALLQEQRERSGPWFPCLRPLTQIMRAEWPRSKMSGDELQHRFRLRIGSEYVHVTDAMERWGPAWRAACESYDAEMVAPYVDGDIEPSDSPLAAPRYA